MTRWRLGTMLLGSMLAWPALGGEIAPERLEGYAAVRTAADGIVAVTVDVDGDGLTDRLYLFAPSVPLPAGWTPRGMEARVQIDATALRVSSLDGTRNLRFLVGEAPGDTPAASESRGLLAVHGVALAAHDRTGLGEPVWGALPEETPLVLPREPGCGENDLDCSSGGLGSTGCDTQCGGGGVSSPVFGVDLAARRCGVSCAAGYYSCCKCDAGGPTCRCREVRAITDCQQSPR